jgi:rRNA maturation endonuclease Nob1
MHAKCLWCNRRLTFRAMTGWTHDNGGLYVIECSGCHSQYEEAPPPDECRMCGSKDFRDPSKDFRDHHTALPRRG